MQFKVKENKGLGEKVYHTVLNSGLSLYVLPKQSFSKKYAIFSTRFGSIDNSFSLEGNGEKHLKVPDGVAHFLEHKLFDQEDGNAFDHFAAYGGSPNAYTSFTQTTYLFSCTDFFPENFNLLLDFVQSPYFTEESVAKEQGIIQQEIRMYQDNPDWRVFFNLLESLYSEHPVRNDIAGSVESISFITKDILYTCYNTFYHPSNMAIFVTGDLSPQEVLALVERNMAGKSFSQPENIQRDYPMEQPEVQRKEVSQELSVSQPIINIGFKDTYNYLDGKELLFRDLACELLLELIFGKSESFYNRLYDEEIIDDLFSADYIAECTYGYTLISARTNDPDRLHHEVLMEIEQVRKRGLNEEDFNRHKRKLRGELLRSFNSLEFIANNYLAYKFRGIEFFDIVDLLQDITLKDLEKMLAEHLQEKYHAISVIKPYSG